MEAFPENQNNSFAILRFEVIVVERVEMCVSGTP